MEQSATCSLIPDETPQIVLRYKRAFTVIALATCIKAMERISRDSRHEETLRFYISAHFYINLQPAFKFINQPQKLFS